MEVDPPAEEVKVPEKKKRGRPRKSAPDNPPADPEIAKKRGRPRKRDVKAEQACDKGKPYFQLVFILLSKHKGRVTLLSFANL